MATQTAPVTDSSFVTRKVTAMQVKGYNQKLRQEAVLPSIWTKLTSALEFVGTEAKLPNAIVMLVTKAIKGAHSYTFGLKMRLKDAPSYGDEVLAGNEETYRLKHLTVYYNLIRKAVSTNDYGVTAMDAAAWDLYGSVQSDLSEYFAELDDQRYQEASLLRYSFELTKAPISLSQRFNPAFFVPTQNGGAPVSSFDVVAPTITRTDSSAPNYGDGSAVDGTGGEWIELIQEAISTASNSYANPEYMNLGMNQIIALDYYLTQTLKAAPIMINGKPTFVLAVPSAQFRRMINPAATGSVGASLQSILRITDAEAQLIPGGYARVGNIIFTENMRAPSLTISGSEETAAIAVGFMHPGNDDGRNLSAYNSSSNVVFDAAFAYGAGALVRWDAQPLKFATEAYDYEMVKGKGAYMCSGVTLAEYNVDDADATGALDFQRACVVIPVNRPSSFN